MMQYCVTSHPDEVDADGNDADEDGWREYIVQRSMADGSGDGGDPLLADIHYHENGTVRSYRDDADFGIQARGDKEHLVRMSPGGTPYCSCSFTTSSGGILCTGTLRLLLQLQVSQYPMELLKPKWLLCDAFQRKQSAAKLRMLSASASDAPPARDSTHARLAALMSSFRPVAELSSQSKTATDDLQKLIAGLLSDFNRADARSAAVPTPRRINRPAAAEPTHAPRAETPAPPPPDAPRAETPAPPPPVPLPPALISPTDVASLKDALGAAYMVHPFDDNTIAGLSCGDLIAVKYAGKKQGGWYAGILVGARKGDDEDEEVKWNGKIRKANYTCSFIKDNTWPAVYLAVENYTDVATAQEHCWLRYGTTPLSSAVPAGGVGNPQLRAGRRTKRFTPMYGPTSGGPTPSNKPSHKKKKT
jgi:hypothetical protein